jgi:type IV secretion system protein VirD4
VSDGHYGLHLGHFWNKKRNAFGAERRLYELDRHAMLFAPTRSGKFTRMLSVNLLSDCLNDRSVIVIDPKGEAAAVTAWHRHWLGHDVKILDPFGGVHEKVERSPEHQKMIAAGLTRGVGFEPLDALDVKSPRFYDDAAAIADALITIEAGERDKHWPESAQGLLIGLLMWEKLNNGEEANLANVRTMLTGASLAETVSDIIEQADTDERRSVGGATITSLLNRFIAKTPEISSIRSAADTQTRWMLSPLMAESFTADQRIDFRKLRERQTTVYVVLPADYLRTHATWLRLVLASAMRALYRPGGLRVIMQIDEMAALGHMGVLEDAFAMAGGYAVQIMGILQDLTQLKGLYNQRWQTFLANAGVIQAFAPNDPETSRWMSERGGPTTAWAKSIGESEGSPSLKSSRESQNWNQVRVDRFPAHDLLGLAPGVGLAWLAGLPDTVMFKAPNYWELQQCAKRALPNPFAPGFRY